MVIEMRSYFAKQGKNIHSGGWRAVLEWGMKNIANNPTPIKLFIARAGEKDARIIAEITPEGYTKITHGRKLTLKDLLHE